MKGKAFGKRMMALADVAVVVSDAKASARWWTKNLGFGTYTIGGSGHAILVAPPGERLVLHLCEGFAPLEPGDTGIAFITDAIDAAVARMTKGGVAFPEPLHAEKWGKMAKFADPDGNIFWLMEVPTPMVRATLNSRAPARKAARRHRRSKGRSH
jgi:catechol 2,3-dioxygenase-like lactoylglutathione lyase family enzyme